MSAFSEIAIGIEEDPTLCADCSRVLHPGNVSVDEDARFWLGATWEGELRCATCKENWLPGPGW